LKLELPRFVAALNERAPYCVELAQGSRMELVWSA